MAKSKKGKSQKKQTKSTRKPKPVIPASVHAIQSVKSRPQPTLPPMERICGIMDPFCPAARGAKWEDGNGASSICYQVRGHSTVASSAYGGNIWYLSALGPYPVLAPATFPTATTTAMAAALTIIPGSTPLTTYGGNYRVVTAGVIIRNMLPALTASGYVIINRLGSAPALSATVTNGNTYAVDSATHPLVAGMEIPVIFRPSGSGSRAFQAQNTSGSQLTGEWDFLSIEVVGAPINTASVLDIEFVYNLEFELLNTYNSLQAILPSSAPSSGLTRQIADSASKAVGSLAHTSVNAFTAAAARYIGSKLASMGGPVTRGAGMLMLGAGTAMDVD